MSYAALLHAFFDSAQVKVALFLIALDFVLGTIAAVKLGTFRLSYLADFARNDILFKLLPYFVVHSAALVAGSVDIAINGLDMGVVDGVIYAALIVAWTGSILASLAALGFKPPTAVGFAFKAENPGPRS